MTNTQLESVLNMLVIEQNTLKKEDFEEIFNDSLPQHLWTKYTEYHKRNLITFFGYLDTENRELLSKYLLTRIK